MYTIDQRILVKTPSFALWDFISNFENNLQWQHDCTAISFLSQKRQGVATRWRQTTHNRVEMVFEILTWYDGLGYEYQFVDGHRYKSCTGRIRLQEIAEGTLLQWTLQYELKGILGGVQNRLGMNNTIQNEMYVSLKSLAKLGINLGSLDNYAPKSRMKDGSLGLEERTVKTVEEGLPSLTETSFALETIATVDDTQPTRAMLLEDTLESIERTEKSPVFNQVLDPQWELTEESNNNIPFVGIKATESSFMPVTETLPNLNPPSVDLTPKEPNQMSIWEIFGIPNPNDTSNAPSASTAAKLFEEVRSSGMTTVLASHPVGATMEVGQVRAGLRKMWRHNLANVRMATKKLS
jgi:hypothetical protein